MKRRTASGAHGASSGVDVEHSMITAQTPRPCLSASHRSKACLFNPNCLHCLRNERGRSWDDPLKLEQRLGPDPHETLRTLSSEKSCHAPSGLVNLGSTCYLNVLVQTICQNVIIRNAIVGSGTDSKISPELMKVIQSLQLAIGHILIGPSNVYSLENFVELMGLSKHVQQDPHEFYKLFFDNFGIHGEIVEGAYVELRSFVTGTETTTVTCASCHRDSSKPAEFQDIELSIEGNVRNIQDCLQHYYREEQMIGENQYFCSNCNRHCDALRKTQLIEPPVVLSVHLLRNIYDRTTLQKKKLMNEITFTEELVIGNVTYILVAALYHKGNTGHSGHYVAEIMQWDTKEWWFCNDDEIFPSDDMTSFLNQNGLDVCTTADRKCGVMKQSFQNSRNKKSQNSSMKMTAVSRKKEVYLLSYVRKSEFVGAAMSHKIRSNDMMQQSIASKLLNIKDEILAYNSAKLLLEEKIRYQKDAIEVLFKTVKLTECDKIYLVPTAWLQNWANEMPKIKYSRGDNQKAVNPEASYDSDAETKEIVNVIDSETLKFPKLCTKHSETAIGIRPVDLGYFKFVSEESFAVLASVTSSVETISYYLNRTAIICAGCVAELCARTDSMKRNRNLVEKFLQIIVSGTVLGNEEDSSIHHVSKESLAILKKRNVYYNRMLERIQHEVDMQTFPPMPCNNEFHSDSDKCDNVDFSRINQNLLCTHGLPQKNFKKKAVSISKDAWSILQNEFCQNGNWDALNNDTPECGLCLKESSENLAMKRASREQKCSEASLLHTLFKRKKDYPAVLECFLPSFEYQRKRATDFITLKNSGGRFYLISSSWLQLWRNYIDDSNISHIEPYNWNNLLCKHGNGLIPSRFLSSAAFATYYGDTVAKMEEESRDGLDTFQLITENECDVLRDLGHIDNDSNNIPICVQITAPDESIMDGVWIWKPVACQACFEDAKDTFERGRTLFENEIVKILKLRPGESLPTSLDGSASTRLQRGRRNKIIDINISYSNTIGFLKLKIFEKIPEAVPILQKLYLGANEIAENTSTLQAAGIRARDLLYLILSKETGDEEDDLYMESIAVVTESEFDNPSYRGTLLREDGFQGTFLGNCNKPYRCVVYDLSSDNVAVDSKLKIVNETEGEESVFEMRDQKRRKFGSRNDQWGDVDESAGYCNVERE